MPAVIALELLHSLTSDGMGDDNGRLFKNTLSRLKGVRDFFHIVSVNLYDMPIPRAPLIGERLKRHNIFRITVYLDVVPVHHGGEIAESLLSGKHGRFPGLATL